MLLAAYMVTGFLLASVYAVGLLRGHSAIATSGSGSLIPFTVAAIAAPVQVVVGDVAARAVFEDQPAKFAAMELITTTGPHQPVTIGGILVDGEVVGGLRIPDLGVVPGRLRPGHRRSPASTRSRSTSGRRRRSSTWPGTRWSGSGRRSSSSGCGRWSSCAPPARLRHVALVPAGGVARRDRRDPRPRGRLDRDRGRTPAVGRLRRPAHGRRGHPVRRRAR